MYYTAYIFLLAILILGAIRLWQAVKAWDVHQAKHVAEDFENPKIDVRVHVSLPYITYKGSSGVLEAYRAGLAFGIAEAAYDAAQARLVSLKGIQIPLSVRQTVIEELINGC